MKKKIELLAPAGSLKALKAAVQAGANAVYLAGQMFGARSSAQNFENEEIVEAIAYCHIRDVKVYVTVNTLVKNFEIKALTDYIDFLYKNDVDAIIVQDLGVLNLVKSHWPDLEIHASTQMSINNTQGVEFLLAQGVKRVVVAREINTKEIKRIVTKTGAEIEVFVHGALCFAYSGQCLMSSMIGGRSGNRGRCAQPCRKKYKLIDKSTGENVVTDGDYLMSPKDLMTLDNLTQILDTGVHSLKIEGRMRKPEYVATVVSNYRTAIDLYLEERNYKLRDKDKTNIKAVFNREFTSGHITKTNVSEILNTNAPGHMGIEIGEVTYIDNRTNRIEVELIGSVQLGDGIKIKSDKNESGMHVAQMWLKGDKIKEAKAGDLIHFPLSGKVDKGARIYKTLDSELAALSDDKLRTENIRLPLKATLVIKMDDYPTLKMEDDQGNTGEVVSEKMPEKALRVALSKERVEEQLKKLGDEPYYYKELNIDLEDGLSLPVKELNRLRRDVIDQINEKRALRHNRDLNKPKYPSKRGGKLREGIELKVNVKVATLEQLKALEGQDLNTVYFEDVNSFEEAKSLCQSEKFELVPSINRVLSTKDLEKVIASLESLEQKSVQINNIGVLQNISEETRIYGDYFLNAFNNEAIRFLRDNDVLRINPSIELSMKELEKIMTDPEMEYELVAYGHIPLMITENCPVKAGKSDIEGCTECDMREFELEDERGYRFPTKCFQRKLVVYNSVVLDMLLKLKEFKSLGADFIRLDFSIETPEEVTEIVELFLDTLNGIPVSTSGEKQSITYGHYFRSIE